MVRLFLTALSLRCNQSEKLALGAVEGTGIRAAIRHKNITGVVTPFTTPLKMNFRMSLHFHQKFQGFSCWCLNRRAYSGIKRLHPRATATVCPSSWMLLRLPVPWCVFVLSTVSTPHNTSRTLSTKLS